MNVIIHKSPENVIRITSVSPDYKGTLEDIGQAVAGKDYRIEDSANLPDQEFRDAWRDATGSLTIDIDLESAKQTQIARLREIRNAELEALDVPMMRAMETQNTEQMSIIAAQKQVLRDATEPLKNLVVSGYNDPQVLDQIRTLGTLENVLEG